MARLDSLSVLLDPTGKMLLAEAYKGVLDNVQKSAISTQLKNTDLSGDPTSGTVEAKRFANATSKAYGNARTNGKGDGIVGKPVTVAIDQDREFVEEVAQKDISLLGVDGLVAKRSANHAMRLTAELDGAFFAVAKAEGAAFVPSESAIPDKIEEAIVALESFKNDYIDGVDRDLMAVVCTPKTYSAVRKYLDTAVNNANVDTAAESFNKFHGVDCYSSVRLPIGVDFIVMVKGSIAQPVRSTPYAAERIPLSEDMAIEMFFYYGTKAVTPETIFYYGVATGLTLTSVAGTTSGDTKVTVAQDKEATANTYAYKTAATVDMPLTGVAPTGFSTWDGSADITATTGNELVIAELDSDGNVVKAGKVVVTAKA